ncbi:MAG: aminotransferase class I/II-fold pyridoxal phosphate-dependent enzyme [Phycisphaerae bacterium]|nr:aminotransferase class I/II-fold pyridoxal phosphate-dependent enzyme [Phycisphaerae bacterium]
MNTHNPLSDPLAEGGFETLCAHYGEHRLAHGGAAAPPLYQSSTFVYPDAEAYERRLLPQSPYYEYTRQSNPTTAMLEAKLAQLERGNWARCFGSGMGAITCAVNACIGAGAHIVAVANCYLPTHEFLQQYLDRFGVKVTFVQGVKPADFIAALRDETRVIYLESPTWGRFELIELAPIVEAARQRGITTIFDNSWATPYFQKPLDLGCDLVVHSATKYIGGHSDALGGVVIGRGDELRDTVLREAELLGAVLDPFAAWLMLRSLRTLAVRLEQHQRGGLAVARMLAEHPKVREVFHPGLESHPQHEVARRQLSGYPGVFNFALEDQTRAATNRFINRLRLFSIGCSWGGHESLALGGTLFDRNATTPLWLIRLHVGLETVTDLVHDVRQALED